MTGSIVVDPLIGELTSSDLMKNPSALALAIRLGVTDALMNVLLPGMIDFFDQGGVIGEINPRDNHAFKQRTGERIFIYKASFLGMKFLDATRLKTIVDMHARPVNRQRFWDLVLK